MGFNILKARATSKRQFVFKFAEMFVFTAILKGEMKIFA